MNYNLQNYKGLKIRLIERSYKNRLAKRYTLNEKNQNVWIPNKHLEEDGTIKDGEDIDYIFFDARRSLKKSGYEIYYKEVKGE